MRVITCFVGALLLSAAINVQLSACESSDDCDCPPIPELPAPQPEQAIVEVAAFDRVGNADVLPADPTGGTAELIDSQLIIRYEQDGVLHGAVYDVIGPGW